jgi:hypothetical protein
VDFIHFTADQPQQNQAEGNKVIRLRLEALSRDHALLRERYDAAVRRTAVTELRVHEGALKVAIRDAAGRERLFDTPFDPADEIYVDYAILDGRLWIRRIFDSATPPRQALVIDPELVDVDWSREPSSYGKAAYRALGEGRWVVSVSGDGSLGLARVGEGEAPELVPPPPVRRFEPVDQAVDDQLGAIGPGEALRVLASSLGLGD